jgi:hypothetical protein
MRLGDSSCVLALVLKVREMEPCSDEGDSLNFEVSSDSTLPTPSAYITRNEGLVVA